MTVVAWDGKTLAADKRATSSGLIRTVTKVWKADGLLCGVAGDFGSCRALMDWVICGRESAKWPECQKTDEWAALLVIDGRQIMKYEKSPVPLIFEDEQFAIGSGRDFALMAMRLGKTAKEAVELTCEFDCACGNGVDEISNHTPSLVDFKPRRGLA